MDIKKIVDNKIKNIIESEKVLGILLIGAGAKVEKEDLNTLRDIDLFVITNEKYKFERELTKINGVLFDISYMSFNALKQAISDEIPFLINSLQNYKFVYNNDNDLLEFLDKIKHVYIRGPKKLEKDEIDYIRFKFYQDFEDILTRKEDMLNTGFLVNNLFYNILTSYFKLHNYWIPKDKKILNNIQNYDDILYNLCIGFIKEEELNEKIKILNKIIDYILKPYGGVIKFWKRSKFVLI